MRAINLKCEYMVNPIGLDTQVPRLTWKLLDKRKGISQSAYQIIVGPELSDVKNGNGNIWDSGKINSDKMLVLYKGKKLKPFIKYYWAVRIWDENDELSELSEVASFATGMMVNKNWQADWISDSEDKHLKPAAYFRKEFEVEKELVSARAYVASAGYHELYLNGNAVSDACLSPSFTRYDKRVLYNTYDVTELIQSNNSIGMILGDGWYNHQSINVWEFANAKWRGRPRVRMELHLNYLDGKKEILKTSEDWKTELSNIIQNSIYTGEHIDNRLHKPGWNIAGFDESKWKNAIKVNSPTENIVAEVMPPIKKVETLSAKSMRKISDTSYVFDFGKNISGVSQLKVKGEFGTEIRLKHGEQLNENGLVDLNGLEVHYRPTDDKDPFQTDVFILRGEGEESFVPLFNYKGFQYVEVTSTKPIKLTKKSLAAHFMHSDVEQIGTIESSDTLINKIWEATNDSYLSNLFGYPTDCPQREKNGWTGDAHIAIETGLFNFDGIKIYEKWMDDHRDEQQKDGVLPAIIPTGGWGYDGIPTPERKILSANGPDWTSTIALIPWNVYLFKGDTHILEENYENIKLYVNHLAEISPNNLTDWGLGDWIPVKSESNIELTSSIYFYTDALILSKIANVLNKEEDHKKYYELANKIKKAINDKFLDKERGIYASGFQTEMSMPLFWGIVPEGFRQRVADNLVKTVKNNKNKLDVGLLGSKTILNALSENGYADLAYKIASDTTYPSWGNWIANGATTLYENWDVNAKSDLSLNHIMFGEISAWYFKALGGINIDESKPGFKNVILKPNFVSGLQKFKATHNGPFGNIASVWERNGENIYYSITIPVNSCATLIIDNGFKIEEISKYSIVKDGNDNVISLKAGRHNFTLHRKKELDE
ncbi:MAG: family 78 glycoside hydrolase catalytic domain [Bacteroidota bacterium]